MFYTETYRREKLGEAVAAGFDPRDLFWDGDSGCWLPKPAPRPVYRAPRSAEVDALASAAMAGLRRARYACRGQWDCNGRRLRGPLESRLASEAVAYAARAMEAAGEALRIAREGGFAESCSSNVLEESRAMLEALRR